MNDSFYTEAAKAALVNIGSADHTFQIFIVQPGLYGLIGSETIELSTTVKPTGTTPIINAQTVGQTFIATKDMHDFYNEVRWHPTEYTEETRTSWSCSLQHPSGVCMAGAQNRYKANVVKRPAGYYEGTYSNHKPGSVYISLIGKHFASFEVKPGEVILTDTFFTTGKNFSIQNKSCLQNDENVQCSIDNFKASRLKTSLEIYKNSGLDKRLADNGLSQHVINTLNRAEYRPLQVSAKVDRKEKSYIGEVYSLR